MSDKSNLSASVAAMSQRLKAARQQQQYSPAAVTDGLILSGRSHSPTPTRPQSPPIISVKAAQADLELRIKELEVTSMTDRIRESESKLSGVTSENDKLRNIIEQLEVKLMTLMEGKEDDLKERQLRWEKESENIVQEFEMENEELRKQVDTMAEELDATKSALLMLQEDYRETGEGIGQLREELEGERRSHADTQGEMARLIAEMNQLEREKGDIIEELEMTKAQLKMSMQGDVQSEYERLQLQLQLDKLSLQKKYSELQQEMEATNAENGIEVLQSELARAQDELKDGVKERDDIINNLRNEMEIARGLHEQELFVLRNTLDNVRDQPGDAAQTRSPSSEGVEVVGKVTSLPPSSMAPPPSQQHSSSKNPPRPIIFLDIDGVLNLTKHNKQIQFEATHLKLLKAIIQKTNALVVLSTFWRHFHEYITYVFHRHGIDVVSCMLPLPMGATRGKQCTYHRLKQEGTTHSSSDDDDTRESMIGRSAEDEAEYSSRAEEIEAWLKMYGTQYLGGEGETNSEGKECSKYEWHYKEWKYVILDDRHTAAKPDTPLFDRFVQTETKVGLTEDDVDWSIEILLSSPRDAKTRPLKRKPSLGVRSLDEIFTQDTSHISPDLAVLLTPECSPTKKAIPSSPKQQQEDEKKQLIQEQPKEKSQSTFVENDDDESLKTSTNYRQYEGALLAAMCDYSNVCPTLVALLQPQTMDDNNDYCPLPTMMKSFEEEKKSFDEIEDQVVKSDDDDNLLEPVESFDSLIDKPQNQVPASCPPMNIFNKFSPSLSATDDNSEDDFEIGLDDLGPRWKTSLSAAVGAPPLTNNEDSDDE